MSSYGMTAIDPDTGQYVEVPIDQGQYVVQDNGLVTNGKSLLKPDLSHSSRNSRITNRKNQPSSMSLTASGILSLGSRFTPSSATAMNNNYSSNLNSVNQASQQQTQSQTNMLNNANMMNNSLSIDRMASAIAGTVSRGRPRGRRPLRGQFPVVPIDMVRQLGIEQQVILQPAAPVAMRNKSLLCRPLCMSRRTQANILTNDIECQVDFEEGVEMEIKASCSGTSTAIETSSSDTQTEKRPHIKSSNENDSPSPVIKYIPIPIPVPVYIPIPVATRAQPLPYICPTPFPVPIPITLLLDSYKSSENAAKFCADLANVSFKEEKSPSIGSKRSHMKVESGNNSPAKKARYPPVHVEPGSETNKHLIISYGINAWSYWVKSRSADDLDDELREDLKVELSRMNSEQLNRCLAKFVVQVKKPNKEGYMADSIFYLCLGIQEFLNSKMKIPFNIFSTHRFESFAKALDNVLCDFQPRISSEGLLICRIEEAHMWEAKQLGTFDSYTLMFTIIYFVTKYFGIRTFEEHANLAHGNFTIANTDTILFHELNSKEKVIAKINSHQSCTLPIAGSVIEDRCPVRIITEYISKLSKKVDPESKFYVKVEHDRGKWYDETESIDQNELKFIFNRIKMVKEIQEASMHNQNETGTHY